MDVATLALLKLAGLYAGLITLMAVALTVLVIRQRRSKLIGIGDGGDKTVARLIRVHGNFCENAPYALALLVLLALTGGPALLVHIVGGLFLLGRILHAYGLSGTAGSSPGRVLGMVLTFTCFAIGAGALILRAVAG
ncbi:MAG: MAPEG family protein [Beijerinckiaceae bacterium]